MSHVVRKMVLCAHVAAVCFLAAGQATGGSLKPDGRPIYTNPDTGKSEKGLATATTTVRGVQYRISLDPNPAIFEAEGNCPWLLPALKAAKQPYNNATNTWDYKFATLEGSFTLVDYTAWAKNNRPTALGTNRYDGGTYPDGFGGVSFVINYNPMGGDPKANDPTLHWMQVIESNKPTARGVAYGVPSPTTPGSTVYMDNSASSTAPNAGVDPYYGHLSDPPFKYANGTGFLDNTVFYLPRVVDMRWQAQSFLSTEVTSQKVVDGNTITVHTVTIYDGVWWGFSVSVPEPCAELQALIGSIALLGFYLRRRAHWGSARSRERVLH